MNFSLRNFLINGCNSLFRQWIVIPRTEISALPERLFLEKLLPFLKVDCVFDVGANNGQYAQMLRQYVGYQGRIISFEPIPKAAEKIRRLAKNDPLWTIEQLALSDKSGTAVFNIMQSDQFSSLGTPNHTETDLFKNSNKLYEQITTQTETLEDAYKRLQKIHHFQRPFLKMDTQGFDVPIAKSGRSIIHHFVGLQSELAIKKLYQESTDFREAISYFESLGFTLGSLVPNNGGFFPEMVEIDCIMMNQKFRSE